MVMKRLRNVYRYQILSVLVLQSFLDKSARLTGISSTTAMKVDISVEAQYISCI